MSAPADRGHQWHVGALLCCGANAGVWLGALAAAEGGLLRFFTEAPAAAVALYLLWPLPPTLGMAWVTRHARRVPAVAAVGSAALLASTASSLAVLFVFGSSTAAIGLAALPLLQLLLVTALVARAREE